MITAITGLVQDDSLINDEIITLLLNQVCEVFTIQLLLLRELHSFWLQNASYVSQVDVQSTVDANILLFSVLFTIGRFVHMLCLIHEIAHFVK